jgi:prevent-host-death family protein
VALVARELPTTKRVRTNRSLRQASLQPPTCATLKHMSEVGIRALKQNASAVVAEASAGATVTITDRGRPVAQLTAIPSSPLRQLLGSGRARAARLDIAQLPAPKPGPSLTPGLTAMREAERF